MVSSPRTWAACSDAWSTLSAAAFPSIQFKPPLEHLRLFPLVLVVAWESRLTPPPGTNLRPGRSTKGLGHCQASFWPGWTCLPQLFFLRPVLQLWCCSLDRLQHLNVFPAMRGPELDTGCEVWSHQHRAWSVPWFCCHAIADESQDVLGLLSHLSTNSTSVPLACTVTQPGQLQAFSSLWDSLIPLGCTVYLTPITLPSLLSPQIQLSPCRDPPKEGSEGPAVFCNWVRKPS